MSPVNHALTFLVSALFDLYIFMLIAHLLFEKLNASSHNPLVQTVVKLTTPAIKPFRQFMQSFRGFDLSIVLLIGILAWVETLLLSLLTYGNMPSLLSTLMSTVGVIGLKVVNFYFYIIIADAVLSWVPSLQQAPIGELIRLVATPLMREARRFIPTVSGIDISAIPVLIALKLVGLLIFTPLIAASARWIFM